MLLRMFSHEYDNACIHAIDLIAAILHILIIVFFPICSLRKLLHNQLQFHGKFFVLWKILWSISDVELCIIHLRIYVCVCIIGHVTNFVLLIAMPSWIWLVGYLVKMPLRLFIVAMVIEIGKNTNIEKKRLWESRLSVLHHIGVCRIVESS